MIYYKFSLIQPKTDRIRPRTFAHKGGYNIRVHRRVVTTYSCTEGLLQHRRALITTKNIAVFNGGMVSSVIAMKSERTLRPLAGVVDDHKGKGQGLSASQDHNAKSSERQIYCDALFKTFLTGRGGRAN